MRAKSFISITLGLWAVGAGVALVHCVGDTNSTGIDAGGKDAANDTASDVSQPPDAGFTLSLAPGHVTEDPGDNYPVTINVNRAAGFNDPVSFVVSTPPGFTATQPAPAGNSSQFYIATSADAGAGDYDITVTGSSTTLVQNVKLGVHVGSMLAIEDGGIVTIPSFATSVEVKVWGAGGGAGPGGCGFQFDSGAPGGPGGFASAFIPVTPGTYTAVVGGGGAFDTACEGKGGGGGGYSGFFAPDGGPLLVAGGGGGGNSVWFCGGSCGYGLGGLGGGGGGSSGAIGASFCAGFGGTQDDGGAANCGATPGTYLHGGSGPGTGGSAGGSPGGGNGGAHAGGGGGGYFGGGGGGEYTGFQPYQSGGGGGGSGYNPFDGGALVTSDSGAPPNTSDSDYANNAGTAGGNRAGGPGRVVIRLPKP